MVDVEQFAGQQAGAVVFEGEPELPMTIETGRLVQTRLEIMMMVLPPMVHQADYRRDPADAAFGDYKLQARITLSHGGTEQAGQAAHLVADLGLDDTVTADPRRQADAGGFFGRRHELLGGGVVKRQ